MHPFKADEIFFLAPYRYRHCMSHTTDIDGFALIFKEDFIANYFNDTLFLYRFHFFYNNDYPSWLQVTDTPFFNIKNQLSCIYNEIKNLKEDSHHLIRAQLYYMLIQLNRQFKKSNQIDKEYFDNSKALLFKKLIAKNIKKINKVTEYADLMGISSSQLNLISKSAFGHSAEDEIRERRISEAKKLILHSDMTFAEI